MNLQPDSSRRLSPCRCASLFFLVFLSWQTLAVPVDAAPLPSREQTPAVFVSSPPLAEASMWSKLLHSVEKGLGSRRRAVQVGVIAMCIALYIMMRK